MLPTPLPWFKTSLRDCLINDFSGAWGNEPGRDGSNARVLRATNLDEEGHINFGTAAARFIDQSSLTKRRLQNGDVLLEASGGGPGKPVGRVACFESPDSSIYLCSNFFRALRPNKHKVVPQFLTWLLLYLYRQPSIWNYQQQTTGIINLKVQDYLNQEFYLPSIEEQSEIAKILNVIDVAIVETKLLLSKLKETRAGLHYDLLTRGLETDGTIRESEFCSDHFRDSPLGRVPYGWHVVPLGSIARLVTSGSRGWADYYSKEGALFIRIGNLTREHINLKFDDVVRVCPPLGGEGLRTKLRPGDVLISITADLGMVGVVPDSFEEAYINQHVALVRLVPNICPRWVGRYLSFGPAAKLFAALNDSGAKAGMSLPSVEALLVAIPPRAEQDQSKTILDAADERIACQAVNIAKLQHLKSGLMTDLLTGRVRVPETINFSTP